MTASLKRDEYDTLVGPFGFMISQKINMDCLFSVFDSVQHAGYHGYILG